MKKALLFVSLTLLTAVGIVTAATSSTSNVLSSSFADPGEEIVNGTVTIGEGYNTSIDEGQNTYKSARGTDLKFYCEGITEDEGVYAFASKDACICNYDIIHGIYRIDIYAEAGTGNGFVQYGYDDYGEYKGDLFTLSEGLCTFEFDLVKPNYFRLSSNNNTGAEPIIFSKMVIYYSCRQEERVNVFSSVHQTINTYNCSEYNIILLETGSNLSSIPLSTLTVNYSINLSDPSVTDLVIEYSDELLKNSTTVVEGQQDVNISFTYNGIRYVDDGSMLILGYDHCTIKRTTSYVSSTDYRIQANNTPFPEDFKMTIEKRLFAYDSSDNEILVAFLSKSAVEITNEMVVTMDADAFTARGDHMMTVSYMDENYTLHYSVYDPEYNNIRYIYIMGNIRVEAGTSVEDFLTEILAEENHVSYYEDDPMAPDHVTLTASNYVTYEGMFDNPGTVDVTLQYQNYVGYISVTVTAVRGGFVKSYTNNEGIEIGFQNITAIHLYDNGVCEFNEKDYEYNELFSYTLVNNVLTINIGGAIMRFDVEDVNNTFVRHVKTETVLYELKVNFSELGAEDEYSYDGTMYDDDTIVFDLNGMTSECAFTVDPSDSNVIYFDFAAGTLYHCKGTIDTSLLQMYVEVVD